MPPTINEYVLCNNCNSYSFFTEDDKNTVYFNDKELILQNENAKENKQKASIFDGLEKYSINEGEYDKHQSKIKKITEDKTKKILEIGFGNGSHLYHLLEKDIDAYGVDIAESLIKRFKENYPKYTDRVFYMNDFKQSVDVVYTSAVFEHIPNPNQFLCGIYNTLNSGGFLVLDNFPVIPNKKYNNCYQIENDISFWKYIHLIIYSEKGLEQLFNEMNFNIAEKYIFDNYRYRVFSEHLVQNYHVVERPRNFFWDYNGLPNIREFLFICLKAYFKHSKAFLGSYILQKR